MPHRILKGLRIRAAGKTDEEITRELGLQLRTARRLSGLSQTKLAQLAGVSRSTVINAESGKHAMSVVASLRCYEAMGLGFKLYFLDEPDHEAAEPQPAQD